MQAAVRYSRSVFPASISSLGAVIEEPTAVAATLALVLALLFLANAHPVVSKLFRVIPLLVFCYFVPTLLSSLEIIPIDASVYGWIKSYLLPASLVLLTLAVDIPAIARLGKPAVLLFLTATAGIVIGGPLAYLAFGWLIPPELGEQTWKGLAALSGSWIGGGANFVAIGESVGASSGTIGMMVVVDVAVANVWLAVLFFFAGREEKMDARIGADRSTIVAVRERVQAFYAAHARPSTLADLLVITTLGIGGAVLAQALAQHLPDIGSIVSGFTWVVIIATTIGVSLSFTRVRRLDGAGASTVGSLFLYLLVASIGAQAEPARILDAPALMLIAALWMLIHAVTILLIRYVMRAPIFFAAVGSQANVGGAASAPIVAAAFHPALAPVGVLLAVGGYVLGTYAALVCAFLLERVAGLYGA